MLKALCCTLNPEKEKKQLIDFVLDRSEDQSYVDT